MPGHLFICGCPRSGTTMLARLINTHPEIVVGIERYGNRFAREALTPALFEEARFFAIEAGDTFYNSLDFFVTYAEKRKDYAGARMVGDKIPLLFDHLGAIRAEFPAAKVVFCVRNPFDVAASWEARARNEADATWQRDRGALAAIGDWNRALEAYLAAREGLDIRLFDYDRFVDEGVRQVMALLRWVGVKPGPESRRATARGQRTATTMERNRVRALDGRVLREIGLTARFDLYREALAA